MRRASSNLPTGASNNHSNSPDLKRPQDVSSQQLTSLSSLRVLPGGGVQAFVPAETHNQALSRIQQLKQQLGSLTATNKNIKDAAQAALKEVENLKQANQGLQDNLAVTTEKYNLLKEHITRIARSLGFNIEPPTNVGQIISAISAYIPHLMNLKSRICNLGSQYGVDRNQGEPRPVYEQGVIAAIERAAFQENGPASPQASAASVGPAAPFAYHPFPLPPAAAHAQQAAQNPALSSTAAFGFFPPHNR